MRRHYHFGDEWPKYKQITHHVATEMHMCDHTTHTFKIETAPQNRERPKCNSALGRDEMNAQINAADRIIIAYTYIELRLGWRSVRRVTRKYVYGRFHH